MRRLLPILAAFGLYCLSAALLFWRPGLLSGTHYLGEGTDPFLYMWVFRFLPWATEHLKNPFIIPLAWAPYGLNITQATTTPGLALLAWPLTSWLGPVVAFNLVSLAAPALAGTTAFLLAREWAGGWAAPLLAGYIFGFSTAVFAEMWGHLQVDFVALIPLAFLALLLRLRGRISLGQFLVFFVVVGIGQFLISLEAFVMTAVFVLIFAVGYELYSGRRLASLLRGPQHSSAVAVVISYLIIAALMLPFLYYFFFDYSAIPHLLQNGSHYSTDLLNFFIPTQATYLGGQWLTAISRNFAGNGSEQLGYIGLPLAAITVIAVRKIQPAALNKALAITLLCALVFTLGPWLQIGGYKMFPLPWILLRHLPLLGNVLPSRLMVFGALLIGIACAVWLREVKAGAGIYIAVAASLVLTIPASFALPSTPWYQRLPKAQLFQGGHFKAYISRGQDVLFFPFTPYTGNAMLWQAEAGSYFKMANGYGNFIPPQLAAWPAAQMLEANIAAPGASWQIDAFLKHYGIRLLIVPKRYLATWGPVLRRAAWVAHRVGRIALFRIPNREWRAISSVPASAAQYLAVRQHFLALKRAARCVLGRHPASSRLDPAIAAAKGCLNPGFGIHKLPTRWDKLGGWLGFFHHKDLGIGVIAQGAVAKKIIEENSSAASKIYYPYPQIYNPKRSYAHSNGQLLVLYAPGKFLRPL